MMKLSKAKSMAMMLAGIAMTVIFGQVAAYSGGQVGDPANDLYYDFLGWGGTILAFAGLAVFALGAKLFSRRI